LNITGLASNVWTVLNDEWASWPVYISVHFIVSPLGTPTDRQKHLWKCADEFALSSTAYGVESKSRRREGKINADVIEPDAGG
jgi:hypothetical protein